MTLAIVLLIMRILSTLLLLGFVGVMFMLIWQDYRSTAKEVEASRRIYGYLVRLSLLDGNYISSGEIYPLLPLTTLGRAPTNTIRLEDQFTSNEHASLSLRSGVWWLEDHQSRNGTNLNGMSITQPVIITEGDIVNIGTYYFRVELEA